MKFLTESLENLAFEMMRFKEDFEDTYEHPGLKKKLGYFRKQLIALKDYKPTYTADKDNEVLQAYQISLNLPEAITILESVTAESNPFDIIDVFEDVYRKLTYTLDTSDEDIERYFTE